MGSELKLRVGDSESRLILFEDRAPATVAALLEMLPIRDRTIQTRWSGNAWRTEGNYELRPADAPVENIAGRLAAGDVIFYPGHDLDLVKIGVAYGDAQWLGPFMTPVDVAHIGRIVDGLSGFVAASKTIIFSGPVEVEVEVA